MVFKKGDILNTFITSNQNLINDFETIAKLKSGDKLAVSKGKLIVDSAGFSQSPKRTVQNLFHGGHNRYAVATYIKELAKKTETLMKDSNLSTPDFTQVSPEDYKKFSRLVKQVSTQVSNIQYAYRPTFGKGRVCKHFSATFDRFYIISKALKEQTKSNPDIFHQLTKPSLDFDAPVDLKNIRYKFPCGRSVDDIVKLSESAKKQIPPTWKKVAYMSADILLTAIAYTPLALLTVLKIVVWNPIEFILKKGEVTTRNPFSWWFDNCSNKMDKALPDAPKKALRLYANQLLRAQVITKEHISAFSKLSDHVQEIQLSMCCIGSNNVDELLSMCKSRNKQYFFKNHLVIGPVAKEALQECIVKNSVTPADFDTYLYSSICELEWLDNPHFIVTQMSDQAILKFTEWKSHFSGDLNNVTDRKNYFIQTGLIKRPVQDGNKSYISGENLAKIIEIASKNKKCRKLELPIQGQSIAIAQIPTVKIALEKGGYVQDKEHSWIWNR